MIVITNPIAIANEIKTIHNLFENGLALLHVRKPTFDEKEMKSFLSQINSHCLSQLVLHSHHKSAKEFSIHRLHFTEKARRESSEQSLQSHIKNRLLLSTSVHTMTDFEKLSAVFDYAFLSPVFESISKPTYTSTLDFKKLLVQRKNKQTKLIALGGITAKNLSIAIDFGFDDVALLGSIWKSINPIENFIKCQKIVNRY